VSVETDASFSEDVFRDVLTRLGRSVLRLKGTVAFGKGPRFVEKVGDDLSVSNSLPVRRLSPRGATAFTVIARGIPADELKTAFAECE